MKKKYPLCLPVLIYANLLIHFSILWNIPYNAPSSRSTRAHIPRLENFRDRATMLPAIPQAALPHPSGCTSGRAIDELPARAWPASSLSAWVQGALRGGRSAAQRWRKGWIFEAGWRIEADLIVEVSFGLYSSGLRFVLFFENSCMYGTFCWDTINLVSDHSLQIS